MPPPHACASTLLCKTLHYKPRDFIRHERRVQRLSRHRTRHCIIRRFQRMPDPLHGEASGEFFPFLSRVSPHDLPVTIGSDAKAKNCANTTIGFRRWSGKKCVCYLLVASRSLLVKWVLKPFGAGPMNFQPTSEAPIIQHPDIPDTLAYKTTNSASS